MALESLFFNSWRLWTYMWPEIAILYAGDFSFFEISKPSRFPFDDSKKKKNVVRSLYNVVQLWFILVDEVSKNESIHPCTICHSVYFHILPKAFLIYFNSSVDVHLLIEIKKEPRQQTTEQFEYNLWLPCVKSLGDHAKAIKVQFSPVNFFIGRHGARSSFHGNLSMKQWCVCSTSPNAVSNCWEQMISPFLMTSKKAFGFS